MTVGRLSIKAFQTVTRSPLGSVPRRRFEEKFVARLLSLTANLSQQLVGLSREMTGTVVRQRLGEFIDLANGSAVGSREDFISLVESTVRRFNQATAEHQDRVRENCVWAADSIGLPNQTRAALVLAARFHDFGKLGWPLIMKEVRIGRSNPWREIIKTHLLISLHFMEEIEWLGAAAQIVYFNHAHDGYPVDCDPTKMPLEAQLLSALDSVDGMIHPRGYRRYQGLNFDYTLRKIRERGYDPQVYALVCEIIQQYASQ
ncbi:MAG: hypothetical protein KJ732_00615 [Candidatus Margulisbacteria bacterium]|nr:hypothetical protein [Candidatus Margulisiibacteriota bacterium]